MIKKKERKKETCYTIYIHVTVSDDEYMEKGEFAFIFQVGCVTDDRVSEVSCEGSKRVRSIRNHQTRCKKPHLVPHANLPESFQFQIFWHSMKLTVHPFSFIYFFLGVDEIKETENKRNP